MVERFLGSVGRFVIRWLQYTGEVVMLLAETIRQLRQPPRMRHVFWQMAHLGADSLPIVGLTLLFTGMVMTLQIAHEFIRFGAQSTIGGVITIAIGRELGPVLVGVVAAGRVGSAITAEISTMKVTEQIDALVTLSTDPMGWLVTPRLWASVLALPLLVGVGDVIGIMGGWLVGTTTLGFTSQAYLANSWAYLEIWDVVSGLIKGAVFGAIIALAGCWFGMRASRGAVGVGRATTNAVVAASVGILASNFILTSLFFT